MGVKIFDLPEEKLLETLGEGDWLLFLSDDYPDLPVSVAWRQKMIDEVGCLFVRWVLAEKTFELFHDWDPPWDHSGNVRSISTAPMELLNRYETLKEWLDEELTGHSEPIFVSGCGLGWPTYGEQLEDDMQRHFYDLTQDHLTPVIGDADKNWEVWDVDEILITQRAVALALRFLCARLTTSEVWDRYKQITLEQIEQEQRKYAENRAHHQKMLDLAQHFWQTCFPDLQEQRIEKPDFIAQRLEERLVYLLAEAEPEVVEAIAEVGLPGYFSDSVARTIIELAKIAKQALED